MAEAKVVIVSGANRGIGRAICEKILAQSNTPVQLYACSRKGLDLNLKSQFPSKVHYPRLDITSPDSISAFTRGIPPRVDVLVNNAGITDLSTPHDAADVMRTNYGGTRDMCLAVLPRMTEGGRVVNISSVASAQFMSSAASPAVQTRLRDPELSLKELDGVAESFVKTFDQGATALEKEGFSGVLNAYPFSKACVNALTAILARDNVGMAVNCCCPGWVDTDLGRIMGSAPKTAEQGAEIPVRLALGDLQGVTGKYWANEKISSTGDGKPMKW